MTVSLRIALVVNDDGLATRIAEHVARSGHVVERVTATAAPVRAAGMNLVVADVELAEQAELVERITSESPGVELVLLGRRGTAPHPDVIDQLDRPVDLDRLQTVIDDVASVLDGQRVREPSDLVAYATLFAGNSAPLLDLHRRVRLVARTEVPVWVFGHEGSGRAVVARAIHDRSTRREQPFVALNTAAYTDDELSRRLFGDDDSAVAAARTGTLFLDRFAMVGPQTQRDLVRYLEIKPDGSGPRLILGLQRDKALDPARDFVSEELFYRLKVLEVEVPPLRARAADLEHIIARMTERLSPDRGAATISPAAMRMLERYEFPGNLMELAHALTHALVLARGAPIEPAHLPLSIQQAMPDEALAIAIEGELQELDVVAKRFEREYLLRVLRSVDGNRGRAAEILGLSRKGLWGKLKAHSISDDDFADA